MRFGSYLRTAAGFAGCAGWLVAAAHADPSVRPSPPSASTNVATPVSPAPTTPIRSLTREREEWRHLLSSVPQLALYANDYAFLPANATKTALDRGGRTRESIGTWTFVDAPFEWKPNAKRSFWIVTGSAGPRVLIAVFEPGAKPKHLASTVLLEPEPALAIGWSTSEPNRLLWTTCYGCPGLGGSIDLAADGQVTLVYR